MGRRFSGARGMLALTAVVGVAAMGGSVLSAVAGPAPLAAAQTSGTTVRVSSGSGTDGGRELPAMSADGRYVVFVGRSSAYWGVYVVDRLTGVTTRLTAANDMNPAISPDGGFVAYAEYGATRPVYLFDRATGTAQMVSVTSGGSPADGLSDYPSVSSDGRYVAFQSMATNLAGGTTGSGPGQGGGPGRTQVYVHDTVTGRTVLASATPQGAPGNGNSVFARITPDGRYLVFASAATDLLPGSAGPEPGGGTAVQQVYVRDLTTGTTRLASVSSAGVAGDGSSAVDYGPSISSNGGWVAFDSASTNLVPGDTNGEEDAFVHNMATGATVRVSVTSGGSQATTEPVQGTAPPVGAGPQISGDGARVAFESGAVLTPDDTNGVTDIYLKDLVGGGLERVSVPAPGGTEASGTRVDGRTGQTVAQSNGADAAIGTDGRYIAFTSNGDLAGDRPLSTEGGATTVSTEPAVYVRTIDLPTVTAVAPATVARARAGQVVTIAGSGFTPPSASGDLTASFGPGIVVESLTWISSTELRAVVDVAWNAIPGERVVSVTNPGSDSARLPSALIVVPRGAGYVVATSRGAVSALGGAPYLGSLTGISLNAPVVGIATTPDGHGYWLVGADGGVFNFGNAGFYGSTGNIHLNQPVVGIIPTPDGHGYLMAARDGGVFNFGDAGFYGSLASSPLTAPIVGVAAPADDGGYWMVDSAGRVRALGTVADHGSAATTASTGPAVAMASE